MTAEAAAASVPFSFTSIKVLCKTSYINSSFFPEIFEKSASISLKAFLIPIFWRVSLREISKEILNFGKYTSTSYSDYSSSYSSINLIFS